MRCLVKITIAGGASTTLADTGKGDPVRSHRGQVDIRPKVGQDNGVQCKCRLPILNPQAEEPSKVRKLFLQETAQAGRRSIADNLLAGSCTPLERPTLVIT